MKKSLPIILLSLLFVACGGNHRYTALMQQADSLLTADKATAAYRLLAAADTQKTAWHRSQRMAYELLKAEAQNKAYIDFKTDSILRPVAQYYDSHGTSNQRLRAHYILGCAYRDMKEAPLAIITWETAIDCADTTAADCDYATLFRVYGQMADVYFRQFMPEKQLEAQQKCSNSALLALDTLDYIRGLLKKNDAYLLLGDTAAVLSNIQYVRQLYLARGLTAEAAQVFQTAIQIALERQQFEKAGQMIKIFETKSNLVDEKYNIAPTYEMHFYYKGIYYLGINQIDSAEYWLRKTLNYEALHVDGYRGLLALYKHKKIWTQSTNMQLFMRFPLENT